MPGVLTRLPTGLHQRTEKGYRSPCLYQVGEGRRVRLNPTRFNTHLAHMGQRMAWRRAYDCPCRNRRSSERFIVLKGCARMQPGAKKTGRLSPCQCDHGSRVDGSVGRKRL